jgi:hypothetical protein
MRRKPHPISAREKERRAEQRRRDTVETSANPPRRLLHNREEASRLLGGVSTAKLIRLEKAGRLRPIKLDPEKPAGMTYYTHENLLAVAGG